MDLVFRSMLTSRDATVVTGTWTRRLVMATRFTLMGLSIGALLLMVSRMDTDCIFGPRTPLSLNIHMFTLAAGRMI